MKTMQGWKKENGPIALFARKAIAWDDILKALTPYLHKDDILKLEEAPKAGKIVLAPDPQKYLKDGLIDAGKLMESISKDKNRGIEIMTENPARFINLSSVARVVHLIVILTDKMAVDIDLGNTLQNQKLFSIQA
jgi:hypothetical protein